MMTSSGAAVCSAIPFRAAFNSAGLLYAGMMTLIFDDLDCLVKVLK